MGAHDRRFERLATSVKQIMSPDVQRTFVIIKKRCCVADSCFRAPTLVAHPPRIFSWLALSCPSKSINNSEANLPLFDRSTSLMARAANFGVRSKR